MAAGLNAHSTPRSKLRPSLATSSSRNDSCPRAATPGSAQIRRDPPLAASPCRPASPLEAWLAATLTKAGSDIRNCTSPADVSPSLTIVTRYPAGLPTVIPCGPAPSMRNAGLSPEIATAVMELVSMLAATFGDRFTPAPGAAGIVTVRRDEALGLLLVGRGLTGIVGVNGGRDGDSSGGAVLTRFSTDRVPDDSADEGSEAAIVGASPAAASAAWVASVGI